MLPGPSPVQPWAHGALGVPPVGLLLLELHATIATETSTSVTILTV